MPSSSASFDATLLTTPIACAVLRVGTGLLLFVMYGLEAVIRAWHFSWKQETWVWVDTLAQCGFPLPHILAPAAAVVLAGVGVAWTLGFLTRLFAFCMLPVVLGALIVCEKLNAEPHAMQCWLVGFISLALLLLGSGSISLDGLFSLGAQLRSGPKKNSNRLSI